MNNRRESTHGLARLLALLGLGAFCLLPLTASGVEAEAAGRNTLKRAVVAEMLQKEEARAFELSTAGERERTQANVERMSDNGAWAFGSAVIEAPEKEGAYPEGWLFVARRNGADWKVGLEGTPDFAKLAEAAPTTIVSKGEKETFAAIGSYEPQAITTGLRLPWKLGVEWTMTGGPHGWSTGYDRPYSSLDFAHRGGRVQAAGGGRVYTMCSSNRGWVRVKHPNGYSTDYYHLRNNIKPRDGKQVGAGAFLGYTGEDVSCGGRASGPHVHFSVLRNGHRLSLDGKTIGGWTFHVGKAYRGYADHDGTKRYPGGLLRNFGE